LENFASQIWAGEWQGLAIGYKYHIGIRGIQQEWAGEMMLIRIHEFIDNDLSFTCILFFWPKSINAADESHCARSSFSFRFSARRLAPVFDDGCDSATCLTNDDK
jgi:hypothetical protein